MTFFGEALVIVIVVVILVIVTYESKVKPGVQGLTKIVVSLDSIRVVC